MEFNRAYREKSFELSRIIDNYITTYTDQKDTLNILDFGCGFGELSYGLKKLYPKADVHGVDIMPDVLWAKEVHKNIKFDMIAPGESLSMKSKRYDVIVSWSVFEHVARSILDDVISDLEKSLKPNGIFILQIAPLFYSSRGAHLWGEEFHPWCHLIEQENILLDKINNTFKENAKSITSTYQTLNKITHMELLDKLLKSNFKLEYEYTTKDPDLERLPVNLRTIYTDKVLETNQVLFVLRKK